MALHIFCLKAKRSKAAHGKRPLAQEPRLRGRGFKWRGTPEACRERGAPRLSRRRYSCAGDRPWTGTNVWREPGSYRSGFRRTWVCVSERGKRDSLLAQRGESLFSRITRRNEKSCLSSSVTDKGSSAVSYDNKDLWHDRDSYLSEPLMGLRSLMVPIQRARLGVPGIGSESGQCDNRPNCRSKYCDSMGT
jgi:hypothetical protein